ncbi:MAG: carboxypeptidase regulatory-like domain-containing protein, partial [Candidatus Aminicenantes bacterium]
IFAAWGYCQDYGNIVGKVTDPEGMDLPGVSVTLVSAYYPERTVVTSQEGTFRFMRLPVAEDYRLTFELPGFKTVVREQLVVSYGRNVVLNITMEPTTLEEEVTVVAETPIIDTRKTQVGITVSGEMLMDLPTSRNPWVIMDLVPGMLVDRVDVGGNEAGQQSAYYGHGSSDADSLWFVDGGNITDNSALGAAPAYVNISNYEELQINYGSNDVISPTGGVQLNIVSFRGGNNYTGSFYLDAERSAWQRENVPSDMEEAGYISAGINKVYLYGANFGGPIIRDKAWFYLAWGIQDIDAKTLTGGSDKTWLTSGYAKLNFQLTPNIRAEAFYEYDNKNKWGRAWIGYAYQAPENLWNQEGPGGLYKGELEFIAGDLLLTGRVTFMDGGFSLTPVGWGSGEYFHMQYYPTLYWYGNCELYGTDRDQLNANFVGTYLVENVMGADHEIKFGADYIWAKTTTYDLLEGNAYIAEFGNLYTYYGYDIDPWVEAWIVRDYYINYAFNRYSAYIQDMMTFGNVAVTLGLRYDREKALVKDQETGAAPHMSNFLPAIKIDEWDPGVAWERISPRLSISWDIFGTGKDVFKVSAARYGSQSGNSLASHVNPGGWAEIDLLWMDDGDGVIQDNELYGFDWTTGELKDPNDPNYWLWYGYFDPADPAALKTVNKFDPDYNSPLLDELMVSYQKELMTDFAARIELFYKKRHKLTWDRDYYADGHLETQDDYFVAGTVTREGETKDYYGRYAYPYGEQRVNSERYTRYLAAQLVLNKRLSNRWMLDASFTYSDWKFYYGGDYANPSNVDFYDGGVEAPESGGSGMTDIFVNSRWQGKLMGLYQLPFGVNISGTLIVREGYVIPRYINVASPRVSSSYSLYFGKMGDTRLPTFWIANLRLEKVFQVGERSRVVLSADGFNITNNNIALKKESGIDRTDFMETKRIINPTVFRFGVRYEF